MSMNGLTWSSARSLDDLGELTARWLEGTVKHNPTNGGYGPDPETHELVPVLAAVNRRGFVTEFSQPGRRSDAVAQRASVQGFCNGTLAETVAAAFLATDVLCIVIWPGFASDVHLPVTVLDGLAHTWAGVVCQPTDIEHEWGAFVARPAVQALQAAHQVILIDPVWGRQDALWPILQEAVHGPHRVGALPIFDK